MIKKPTKFTSVRFTRIEVSAQKRTRVSDPPWLVTNRALRDPLGPKGSLVIHSKTLTISRDNIE